MRIFGKGIALINSLLVYLQKQIFLLYLLRSKQKGLIDDFHYDIKKEWVSFKKHFGLWDHFYQTHPKLNISGVRPTISRLNNYKLFDYINNQSVVLDIGCNTGFLSSYLSSFVMSIDAVEYDQGIFSIATKTIDYLSINNIKLFNMDIKEFQCTRKYDLVMSFAIHRWVGIGIKEYLGLLMSFKKDKGLIIIESHPYDQDKLFLKEAIANSTLKKISEGVTDDHLGNLRDFYILS